MQASLNAFLERADAANHHHKRHGVNHSNSAPAAPDGVHHAAKSWQDLDHAASRRLDVDDAALGSTGVSTGGSTGGVGRQAWVPDVAHVAEVPEAPETIADDWPS